jgi:hypothetical protein
MRAGLDDLFLALVNNLDASDADHLWAFSFLEDLPAAILALKTTSPSYQSFLERCSGTPFPFFLQKMARFQLVIRAAHGFRSGVAYVTWVRSREEDTDADMDAHLADSGESPTTFLLRRLRTRYLDNALPITVYRLGIFGSVEAIPALETVWTQYDDSDLRALTDEAIGRIRRRIETSRG